MAATSSLRYAIFNSLFSKRDCVLCDTSQTLVCPACPADTQCQFITPTNCNECPRATCVAEVQPAADSTSSGGSSSNVASIAGGVAGGVVAIAIATFCVWWFCIRTKRERHVSLDTWEQERAARGAPGPEKQTDRRRENRNSTHTTHSIASTVLTRASNIIQIAYIPGVTNRATPTSPTLLVPPVPPIPIAHSQASSPSTPDDQHFFVPGDLRDSTYSALSGFSDRISYARTSYAPRSSVASTIYGKNAVIVAPAQTGMRAKPAMVSVKSGGSGNSSGSITPPVPTVDFSKYGSSSPCPSPANSEFSVGSTFLNANAATAKSARPMVVRVGNADGGAIGKPSPLSQSHAFPAELEAPPSPPLVDLTPELANGPFSDPVELADDQSIAAASLSSRKPSPSPRPPQQGPFGDDNATAP
jgi:hypothetical protein